MTEAEARAAVVDAYGALARLGMNTGSTGNVSIRFAPGMIITPSGVSAETIRADGLVGMALAHDPSPNPLPQGKGAVLHPLPLWERAGVRGRASSEWEMHAGIYAACPEASFIIHTHADACTALSCLNEGLPAFHYMIAQFGGEDVRCAPYVTFGTPELAAQAVTAIAGRRGCLLANHGMIVHGSDAAHALLLAQQLEMLCRQYLLARSAGTPRLLTPDEMRDAKERFKTYAAAGS
ncbi:MAG: class II aldolase/adducin family protein [Alphaproteobacteria bacterium]|nr:class II aldolase/adducin family protein [Alphaproteobacteria bacterium]